MTTWTDAHGVVHICTQWVVSKRWTLTCDVDMYVTPDKIARPPVCVLCLATWLEGQS
jgi:hypothetical protein